MKREIPPALAVVAILIVLAVVGFFYARHWFSGPKRVSGTPPPGVNLAPPPPGLWGMPWPPPPPPGQGW
ncbi:MAG: hypothetical protein RMM06_11410 [Armatimonadota bacterium]|nr:hypothetical protein [Armatimonadota bacterium]